MMICSSFSNVTNILKYILRTKFLKNVRKKREKVQFHSTIHNILRRIRKIPV